METGVDEKRRERLPRREDIPTKFKWNLEDIYPSKTEWENDFRWVKERLPLFESFKGKLGESPDVLLDALNGYSETMEKVEKLYVYAHMKKDENNTVAESQALLDKAQSLLVEFESGVSFLLPEILTIPPEKLDGFISSNKGFNIYRHYIEDITRQREHILSAREEQILAMAGEVAAAPKQIFSMINNADIKFPVIVDEKGEEVELTKGNYIKFMESRDRRVRKDAFTALYQTYGKHRNTIASTLNYSIKKDIFFSRIRKYQSALDAALDSDNVPVSVYDNLIKAVEDNMGAMHQYVRLRKKALGLSDLHMYDLYVPIVKDVEMRIPYEQAQDMVLRALSPLGPGYQDILKEGFQNGWIDVMENQGKTSGAYAWGCYDTHPYVLLNYQNTIDDVFTLAHEMGHAIHTYLSNKNQPYILSGYKIFVAEVASTLNEVLLTHYLLDTLEDKQQKAYIINHFLEQFRGAVYRQTMFAEFEKDVHKMAENGDALTVENLSGIYRNLNEKYYGPDMVVDDEIRLEWARIPHFYTAFYVYKYATGFSAAAALARNILQGDEGAVDRYIEFLSSGGSDYPINLLKRAGVDMTSVEPVNDALKTFVKLVEDMEKLV